MGNSDFKGPRVYKNKVGMYAYEVWYEAGAKKFAVVVIASNGARGPIGYVDSYVDGERLFHEWLANNIPLSNE